MAKSKKRKPAKAFIPEREVTLAIDGNTAKKKRKTDKEIFWDLKQSITVKELAKQTGKSERTIRSYYKFLSGQSMDRADRQPSKEFYKKLKPIVKKLNSGKIKKKQPRKLTNSIGEKKLYTPPEKIENYKSELLEVTHNREAKQREIISKERVRELQHHINHLGAKYSYTIVRLSIRYHLKHGETFVKYQSVSTNFTNANDIVTKIQKYINSMLRGYVKKAEIFKIEFQVVARKKEPKK